MKSFFTTNYLIFQKYSFLSNLILLIAISVVIMDYGFGYELHDYLILPYLAILWLDIAQIIFNRFYTPLYYAQLTDYQKKLYNQINQ